VLTQGPLTRLVPVENASMPDRSVIQWDKDDLDAVGLLESGCAGPGHAQRHTPLPAPDRPVALAQPLRMQDVPAEDPATYAMICQADTVGVFQIESRAQMSMLPRLKPQLLLRPGGRGGHRAARADPGRHGAPLPEGACQIRKPVTYASPGLEEALKRTLGVPIFQEQVMQIAMAAAGFTPGEADQLRRSMAAWKRKGGVGKFYDRLVGGMLKNGYTQEFADTAIQADRRLWRIRLPREPCGQFCLAGVRELLAQAA